jgi:hypothetical protein
MNIHKASCRVSALLIVFAASVGAVQAQSETAYIEVLVKNEKPIRVEFSALELEKAASDSEIVHKKLIDKVGKAAECSAPRKIGDGIWACRDGAIVRTKDDVLKKVLTKLYR